MTGDPRDLWLALPSGARLPVARSVLVARTGLFRRMLQMIEAEAGPDSRLEIRTTFPFPDDAVAETLELLHADRGSAGGPVDVPARAYGRVREVLDFLDAPARPRLGPDPTWADRKAMVLDCMGHEHTRDDCVRAVAAPATDRASLRAWLEFLDDLLPAMWARYSKPPDAFDAVVARARADMRAHLVDSTGWELALDTVEDGMAGRRRRFDTLCLAFPDFLAANALVVPWDDEDGISLDLRSVFEPDWAAEDDAVALVSNALCDRRSVASLATRAWSGDFARVAVLVAARGSRATLSVGLGKRLTLRCTRRDDGTVVILTSTGVSRVRGLMFAAWNADWSKHGLACVVDKPRQEWEYDEDQYDGGNTPRLAVLLVFEY